MKINAALDAPVIWYPVGHPLAFLNGTKLEPLIGQRGDLFRYRMIEPRSTPAARVWLGVGDKRDEIWLQDDHISDSITPNHRRREKALETLYRRRPHDA